MTARLTLQLDWLVHQPARLGMMMMLAEHPRSFTDMKKELGLNGGKISAHASYLEAVGYLRRSVHATTGRICKSTFHLTTDGWAALTSYYVITSQLTEELRSVCDPPHS